MVPLVDVGLVALVAALCPPDTPVVWSPQEAARKRLAVKAATEPEVDTQPETTSQGSINLPGVAVFRTGTDPDPAAASIPEGHRGWGRRYRDDTSKDPTVAHAFRAQQKRRNVLAHYEIGLYGRTLTQLNDLERPLSFIYVYHPVLTLSDGTEYPFLVESEGMSLTAQIDERTDMVTVFSSLMPVTIRTFWMLSSEERVAIQQIYDVYENVTSGNVIDHRLIENLVILPKD